MRKSVGAAPSDSDARHAHRTLERLGRSSEEHIVAGITTTDQICSWRRSFKLHLLYIKAMPDIHFAVYLPYISSSQLIYFESNHLVLKTTRSLPPQCPAKSFSTSVLSSSPLHLCIFRFACCTTCKVAENRWRYPCPWLMIRTPANPLTLGCGGSVRRWLALGHCKTSASIQLIIRNTKTDRALALGTLPAWTMRHSGWS